MANALDTSIILSGRQPDIVGTLQRAAQGGQQARQFKQRNALDSYLQGRGTDVMRGDPQAMNALAQFGVQGVEFGQGVQANNLNMQNTRQSMEARTQQMGLANSQEQRAIETHLAGLSKTERDEAQRGLEAALTRAIPALQAGDLDGINQLLTEGGLEPVGSLEEAQVAIASADNVFKTLQNMNEMNATPDAATFRPASSDEAANYGAAAGQIDTKTGRFYPATVADGMRIVQGADGSFTMEQGPGVTGGTGGKAPTEADAKSRMFLTQAQGANDLLTPELEDALTSRMGATLEAIPLNLGRGAQTDDYQMANQAAQSFVTAILRKETGAAVTPQEQETYERLYIPKTGDKPALIEQKRQARIRALNALEAGTTPEGIVAAEEALRQSAIDSGSPAISGGLPPVGGPDIPPAGGQGIVDYTPDQIMTMPQGDFNAMTTEQLRALSPEARQAIRARVAAAQQGGME